MPGEGDHPQHGQGVVGPEDERGDRGERDERGRAYLACYQEKPASWATTIMWIRILGHFSRLTSSVRRRSEQSDAQSRKHSYHVPTEREEIYDRFDDGKWDDSKSQNWGKPAKPRTYALFVSHNWQIQRSTKFAETTSPFFGLQEACACSNQWFCCNPSSPVGRCRSCPPEHENVDSVVSLLVHLSRHPSPQAPFPWRRSELRRCRWSDTGKQYHAR